jgi:hypothetical protein
MRLSVLITRVILGISALAAPQKAGLLLIELNGCVLIALAVNL